MHSKQLYGSHDQSTLLTRRTLLGSVAAASAGLTMGGLGFPGHARAATTVNFQTSAGARFGTPNAALIEDFNKENPDIQIVMDTVPVQNYFPKLSTEVASKSPGLDFFTGITNLLYAFAATGKIVPMDEVISAAEIADLEKDIPAHYLDTWRYKGRLYALPNDSNAQWSFYRKDLFDAAGVSLPAKWEDATAVAKSLTKNGVYGYTASSGAVSMQARIFQVCSSRTAAITGTRTFIRRSIPRRQEGHPDHAGTYGLRRSGFNKCWRGRYGPGDCPWDCRLGPAEWAAPT